MALTTFIITFSLLVIGNTVIEDKKTNKRIEGINKRFEKHSRDIDQLLNQ